VVFFEIASNPYDWELFAHSYGFERDILDNVLIPQYGFPSIPLEIQHCTQRLALANAFPAELGLLAQALDLPYRKDPAARKAMLQVSRPKTQRKRRDGSSGDDDPPSCSCCMRCKLEVSQRRVARPTEASLRNRTPLSGKDAAINARGLPDVLCHGRDGTGWRAIKHQPVPIHAGAITSVGQNKRFLDQRVVTT
jgi:hypothetical protein